MTTTWLGVWTRAVIGPAYRRAGAVWVGCAIVAAIIFGPTAMHPRDLTRITLGEPGALAVLGGAWLLIFAPIARGLLHADAARFLRSLPAPRVTPLLVQAAALVGLQLPWLLLWVVGDGARGLVVVAASTIVVCVVAWWRPSRRVHSAPRWRSALGALRGVYLGALARRAGDALVRGAGLALVAGLAGGLFVRNNQLVDEPAARIAASVIALVLVPAQVGVLGVLLDAHRRSTWLARSLGITHGTRVLALVLVIAVTHLAAAALAIAGAALVLGSAASGSATLSSIVWIAGTCLACALGSASGTARVILGAVRSPSAAVRMAVGSLAVGVATIASLTLFGAALGALAFVGAASFSLSRVEERTLEDPAGEELALDGTR